VVCLNHAFDENFHSRLKPQRLMFQADCKELVKLTEIVIYNHLGGIEVPICQSQLQGPMLQIVFAKNFER
jgi:hypothetical protein